MKKSDWIILIVVIAMVATVASCQKWRERDPATGQQREMKGFDPCFVNKVDKGFNIAGQGADVAAPFVPIPYRWLYELIVVGGSAAKMLWDKVKVIKLKGKLIENEVFTAKVVHGARAAGVAIKTLEAKPETTFATVAPGLEAAKAAGAIMPHKIVA